MLVEGHEDTGHGRTFPFHLDPVPNAMTGI